MAESPDEIYERVLGEEQEKGSSPAVAQARAKAARVRAQRGLPIDPAAAASESQTPAAKPGEPPAEAEKPEEAEKPQEAAAPEEKPEEAAAEKPEEAAPVPSGDGRPREGDGAGEREPAAVGAPARAAQAQPRGRGAAARAARAEAGAATPERLQRLLAVVKPEAIQRVEREPIDRVNTWPHLMSAEFLSLLVVTLGLVIFSALVDAPFRELANINQTPNPSKAPWYFLGLQELLRYFHPQIAGVTIPQWIIVGFGAAPYIDRNPSTRPRDRKLAIVLFTIFIIFNAVLIIAGSLFRGPGFNWVYPWEIPVGEIFEL